MGELPIERLLQEKKEDAIEVHDENTLEFLSPDRHSSSKMIYNKWKEELTIETTLYHGARMIDENIYVASNILAANFTEEQIREIIEDVSARLRQMELPKMLQTVAYNFKIEEQDESSTKFAYTFSYEEFSSYETLKAEVEKRLMYSFELIYGYLIKISFFIESALNQFLLEPVIELKLLEIRKLLFRARFYDTMTGRFAGDQRRIAQSMKKDALNLLTQFQKEYPDLASERLQEIQKFFEL